MGAYIFPVDAVSGAPSFTGRMLRQLLGVLTGGGTAARPLAGRSGVNPRTPATTVAATSTTWTVHPHGGYIDGETSASAGGYLYSFDTDQTGAMNAADASNPRIDLISVRVSDPAESDGTANPKIEALYTVGTPAAIPVPPATPARSMVLAQINVPKLGTGSPSVSWVAPYTVASGGIVPASGSTQYPPSPYLGQYIDDASLGLLRWDGSAWGGIAPAKTRGRVSIIGGNADGDSNWHKLGSLSTVYNADLLSGGVTLVQSGLRVPAAGTYAVAGSLVWQANATGSRALKYGVNGSELGDNVGFQSKVAAAGGNNTAQPAPATFLDLNANDIVNLYAWQNSGTNLSFTGGGLAIWRIA